MTDGEFRDFREQGIFPFQMKKYGMSVEGVPLRFLPAEKDARLLVFAAIHGEEAETTFLLSRALRMLARVPAHVACVLTANPDGLLRGTRANARGVDLNRNFPTEDWTCGKTYSRLTLESPKETALDTGAFAGSEPETSALIQLILKLNVRKVIALHSPFGLIDSDFQSDLTQKLETVFELPWQSGVGYPTPGSFGTFARERQIECVTVELPRLAPEILVQCYGKAFAEFLMNFC